ncbi:hypothetical protein D9M71_186930 [compost metagenome]
MLGKWRLLNKEFGYSWSVTNTTSGLPVRASSRASPLLQGIAVHAPVGAGLPAIAISRPHEHLHQRGAPGCTLPSDQP